MAVAAKARIGAFLVADQRFQKGDVLMGCGTGQGIREPGIVAVSWLR